MKSKILLFFIIFMVIIARISYAFAANSTIDVRVKQSATQLYTGDEVKIVIGLQNFVQISQGINVYKGIINYDKNVFESLTKSNFTTLNKWIELEYNPDNRAFSSYSKVDVKDDQDILEIRLKVKSNADAGNTIIEFKDFTTSEGKNDIVVNSAKIGVNIIKRSIPSNIPTQNNIVMPNNNTSTITTSTTIVMQNNNSNIIRRDNSKTNIFTGSVNNNNKNIVNKNNTAQEGNNREKNIVENSTQNALGEYNGIGNYTYNYNKNDDSDYSTTNIFDVDEFNDDEFFTKKKFNFWWIFIVIIIIALIIFFVYIYKNNGKSKKINKFTSFLLVLALFGCIAGNVNAMGAKGEINGDYEINYSDIKILQRFLIGLYKIDTNRKEFADLNNNGIINITDLSLLLRKIEKNKKYDVTINNVVFNVEYAEKNSDIVLTIDANATENAIIEQFKINGEDYNVTKVDDRYQVTIKAPDKSGKFEIKFEYAKLDTEYIVKLSDKKQIEVLKDVPQISNYKLEEKPANNSLKISFDVDDKENSFNSGHVVVQTEAGTEVNQKDINVGENSIEFSATEGTLYKALICITANRDSTNGEISENVETFTIIKDALYTVDYEQTISDIKVYNESGNEINEVVKGSTVNITFKASNKYDLTIEKIKINNRYYDIQPPINGLYTVRLDNEFTDVGAKMISISAVTLSNGKEVEVDYKKQITAIKAMPSITTDEYLETDTEFKSKIYITDKDNTISSARIFVYAQDEITLLYDGTLSLNTLNEITIDTTQLMVSDYVVLIKADYNLYNDKKTNAQLYKEVKKSKTKTVLINSSVSDEIIEKQNTFKVEYTINTNKGDILSFIVNNQEYIPTKKETDRYEITMTAPDNQSGDYEINLTGVVIGQEVVEISNTKTIEILKSPLEIKDYRVEDVKENNNLAVDVKFNIIDIDDSIVSGKVELIKKEDNSIVETKNFTQAGNQTIRLNNVENAIYYNIRITADYALDKTKNKDRYKNSTNIENEYIFIDDYALIIDNYKTTKLNGTETTYFEKNESIRISFTSSNVSKYNLEKAVINGTTYILSKNEESYYVDMPAIKEAKEQEYILTSVTLSNTKTLELENPKTTKVEILKDKPSVKDVNYLEDEEGKVTFTYNLVDNDNTLESSHIEITNSNGVIVYSKDITKGQNEAVITVENEMVYTATITATYYLNKNKTEDYKFINEKLLSQDIDTGDRNFEMKDIVNVNVYRKIDSNVELQEEINMSKFSNSTKGQYIAEVELKDMQNFYTTINNIDTSNDILKLTLDYDELVQYQNGEKETKLVVTYGKIQDGYAYNTSLDTLKRQMLLNPNGDYELLHDMDFSNITSGTSILPNGFSGTLNGNGHKIYNLKRPLFDCISGATIENLVIEDADVRSANGILANSMTSSTIKNVHVTKSKMTGGSPTGGLIGFVTEGSTDNLIEECSVSNSTISGGKRTGGFMGWIRGITLVKNCYVQNCMVAANSDAEAGFIGEADHGKHTFENCYVDAKLKFTTNTATAGVSGYRNTYMKNVLSLATSQGGNPYGARVACSINGGSSNNYELASSDLSSNASHQSVTAVEMDEIMTEVFFANSLKWDSSIWDWSKVSENELPTLKNADPRNNEEKVVQKDKSVYIPNYEILSKYGIFDENKEKIYGNLYKLMPFYESKYLLIDGGKINTDHILNTEVIKTIIPFNSSDKAIFGLSKNNAESISYIKVLFENGEVKRYNITYKETKENIACYEISELNIGYTYNKYLVDTNSQVFNNILSLVNSSDYNTNLNPLTEEAEVRNYYENYPKAKTNANNFVLYLLSNNPEYNYIKDSEIIKTKIYKDMIENNQLYKLLYAYNYFDRFYDISVGGMNVRDIVFFDTGIYTNKLNSIQLTNTLLSVDANTRSTNNTQTFYNNNIKPMTNIGLGDFIGNIAEKFTDYEDDNAWFRDYFKGTIYEAKAKDFSDPNGEKFLEYRAWERLIKQEKLILPSLTYNDKDYYIATYPTGMTIGNLRRYFGGKYPAWENVTDKDINDLMSPFFDSIALQYNTLGNVLNDRGFSTMAGRNDIGYDSTGNKPKEEIAFLEGIDPMYKYIYEVIDVWPRHPSAGAYANTVGGIYYCFYGCIDRNNRVVWSHENAHNQNHAIFFETSGWPRFGSDSEMYTDGFLTQQHGSYEIHPNYMWNYNLDSDYTTNFRSERLAGREKIQSYYKNMFEVFDALTYLEGEAFLDMSSYEQSQIARKATVRTAENGSYYGAGEYETIDENMINQWKSQNTFNSISDLWDHKVVANRNVSNNNQLGSLLYVGSSPWYYANADTGYNTSFKVFAYQILADYGYTAYASYCSGKRYDKATDTMTVGSAVENNDLILLRDYAGNPNMTWKEYHTGRYAIAESKVKQTTTFNYQDIINNMKNAMGIDVQRGVATSADGYEALYRKILYGYFKRITNDFEYSIYDTDKIIQNEIHIANAEDLMRYKNDKYIVGNFVLDNNIDFSNIDVQNDTYLGIFMGKIKGNGYKITGLEKPLFTNITYSIINDLEFNNIDINIEQTYIGILSKRMKYTMLNNIILNNIEITTTGVSNNITSVGGLVGEAERIIVDNVEAKNVNIHGTGHDAGGIFGRITYSALDNIYVKDGRIEGNSRVGGISGYGNQIIKISKSTTNIDIVGNLNEIGGFIGQLDSSYVENSYSLGTVNGNTNVGGFVGWAQHTKIDKCFANVEVAARSNGGAGGFLGNGRDTTAISNSIAYGKVVNGYKFDARSEANVINNYSNNYEYSDSIGNSNLNKPNIDWTNKVSLLSISRAKETQFFTDALHWDNNIWDFANANEGGVPKFKNSKDTNNVTNIVEKIKISNYEEFKEQLNENPDKIFELTNNIDMSNHDVSTSVITTTFTGRIDGNNYTISNLNGAALFDNFNGNVQDLKIKDFINIRNTNVDNIAAFAIFTNGATFTNVKFENIELKGRHRVSVVSTTDNSNSSFNRVSVKNANVIGTGVYVSTFVGRKYSGFVKDCYVQGTITCNSTEAGGITGASQNGGQFENVIANVNMIRLSNTDGQRRNNNGGFVGNIYNSPKFKNCISIGTMTGYESGGTIIYPYKFSGAAEPTNINCLENCYEVSDNDGLRTMGTINTVTKSKLKQLSLYKDTLKFNGDIWNFNTITENGYPELK